MKPNGNKIDRKDEKRFKMKHNSIQTSNQSELAI